MSPAHNVDVDSAELGSLIFEQLECSSCHTPTLTTGGNSPFAELRPQKKRPHTNLLLHTIRRERGQWCGTGSLYALHVTNSPPFPIPNVKMVSRAVLANCTMAIPEP
ncbi:di-heme oxidoredictase family protein [Microbulbifer okhotskensis]|uniref:di-heme oxidoredictase family protein n=1 Tax=Microbulbifer okhotskensis TaxID=2926617 RepID=UPI00359C3051